jgi:predicted  nucleic acid-binding Zn-ribbon protein
MGDGVEAIYRLQLIDTEMDEGRAALRSVRSQLADDEEVLAAANVVRENEETTQKLRSSLRVLEMDLQEVLDKIGSTEGALYGGEVTSPKELAGMEQELEYLKRRQSSVEDDTLLIMSEVEEQEQALEVAREELSRTERSSDNLKLELRKDEEELLSRLTVLEAERMEIAQLISQQDLRAYEDLRSQKGGQAVALLENGICQGCRVALPTSVVQRVRRGSEVVYCGSCQRIRAGAVFWTRE